MPFCQISNFACSTCINDPEYSQYDCYENKMNDRLKDELKCLWPFQAHNKLNIGKDICDNLTELQGRCTLLSNSVKNIQICDHDTGTSGITYFLF